MSNESYQHKMAESIDTITVLQNEVEQLRARIAELEAAQQWTPASEPPEDTGAEYLLLNLDYTGYWQEVDKWDMRNPECVGWCDLPPLPEKGTEA